MDAVAKWRAKRAAHFQAFAMKMDFVQKGERRVEVTFSTIWLVVALILFICFVFVTGKAHTTKGTTRECGGHHGHDRDLPFQKADTSVQSQDQTLWGSSKAPSGVKRTKPRPYQTGFHFQPVENWMSDPNGMLYYMGWYHLFYQYNPFGALRGHMFWGHAVSKDLVHWSHVKPFAIKPGPGWYDVNGAWSGSSTILDDGTPAILYTGWSNASETIQIQTQNLALPVNKSDPLLREWYKSDANPVMTAESFMDSSKYRNPSEAWKGQDGKWRTLIGGRMLDGTTGTTHLYTSEDFANWTYAKDIHSVAGTGMWECPDLFPVSVLKGTFGVPFSVNNPTVKHVLKVSIESKCNDYYSVGEYDEHTDTFVSDYEEIDVGIGLRYDYGKFYASRSFMDTKKSRRILFGWVSESDSDLGANSFFRIGPFPIPFSRRGKPERKGWSGLQSIPRQLWLDPITQVDLIQTPIKEIDELHRDKVSLMDFPLPRNTTMRVQGVHGPQLDIQIKFYKPYITEPNLLFDGSNSAAQQARKVCKDTRASHAGFLGPFGLLVLADKDLKEQTAVFFYLQFERAGTWKGLVCNDQGRSSLRKDVDKSSYGTYVRVLERDKYLTLRTIVDHSIVETFAQGGRTVVTSRVYPTLAKDDAAHFFLFNNGTQEIFVHTFNAWRMESAK